MTPFDWYDSRFSHDFRLELLADNDHDGIVTSSNSLIEKISVLANGGEIIVVIKLIML